jgi:hypothetical protein
MMAWRIGMPDEEVRSTVIRHEAAHLLGAIHVRADIYNVEIRSPRTTVSYLGAVQAFAETDWGNGVIEFAGAAWTALFELQASIDAWRCAVEGDVRSAYGRAVSGCFDFEDLERYTVRFIQHQHRTVLRLAQRIESELPKSGILGGRRLSALVRDFERSIPCRGLEEMRGWERRPGGTPMKRVVYEFDK